MAPKRRKKKHKGRIAVLVIILILLFAGCMFLAYYLMASSSPYIKSNHNASTPQPTSLSPTRAPYSSPSPSPSSSRTVPTSSPYSSTKPTSSPRSGNSGTATYSDNEFYAYSNDEYGFECPYPKNFTEYSGGDSDVQTAFTSPDGNAYEYIIASDYPNDTPAMDMREFVSSYPTAQIIENRAGSDYFYALIKYDDMYVYRYEAYSDGTSKGFEFGYNEDFEYKYSDYPKEIRSNFTLY